MATPFTTPRMLAACSAEDTRSRPTPIGEEAEVLEKSGRGSNKSSNSSRQSSRTHSPVIQDTPRKGGGGGGAWEGGDEGLAPLGYEPCGSAENISPFSERATPPYLEWARDLQYILNDYEGQALFRRYLSQETCCNVLDFYYACKGLKYKSPSNDGDEIKELVFAIYRKYIRPQGDEALFCVRKESRTQINAEMHMKSYRQPIFDSAVLEAEDFLRMKHAAFVESEIYLDYVQRIQMGELESPRIGSDQESHSSSSSTSGDPPRSSTQLLPTVQEETEEGSGRESSQSGEGHARCPPPLPPRRTPAGDKGVPKPLPSKSKKAQTQKETADPFSVVTMRTLKATVHQRSSTLQKNSPGMPPNPYHVQYVPRLPPSTQDSELQSMSSDADSFSMTENSSKDHAKRVQNMNTHKQNQKDKYLRLTQQQHNLESNLKETIIPRTMGQTGPKISHSTERERMVFHRLVCEKLEVVRREREKDEKLQESLLRLSEPAAESNPRARRAVAQEYSSYVQSVGNEDDTTILDYHMQQLGWNDSEKASPHRSPGTSVPQPLARSRPSPGSKSPDRWGLTGRHMTSSYPSNLITAKIPNSASGAEGQAYVDKQRSHHQSGSAHGRTSIFQQDRKQAPQGKFRSGKSMGPSASDTSGIESGTSSGASQVSALIAPPHFSDSSISKQKNRMPTSSHRPSSHKGASDRQQKGQKVDSASLPRTHKNRRSEGSGWVGSMAVQSAPTPYISLGYYLPNDTAPFVTKTTRNVTLKQFKQLLPKKYQEASMYKYFFKCASNEFETGGVVQKEVTDDFEILPLWEGKVMAKVVEYR